MAEELSHIELQLLSSVIEELNAKASRMVPFLCCLGQIGFLEAAPASRGLETTAIHTYKKRRKKQLTFEWCFWIFTFCTL
jgi:hypothetical protein